MTRARDFANFGSDAPTAIGTAGQALLVNSGATAYEWAEAGGGAMEFISTQTISTATAQAQFDLSNTAYGSFYIYAQDCTFTAAPANSYCLYFTFYDGAYDSGSPSTNRMSVRYQRIYQTSSSLSAESPWSFDLAFQAGSTTPTTSTKFGFSGIIGGGTNSPIDLTGYFGQGSTASHGAAPRLRAICPNTSDNMTYMLVHPSTTTFATGKFSLYGIKDS